VTHARLALAAAVAATIPLAACESAGRQNAGDRAHRQSVERMADETPDSVSPLPADLQTDLDRNRGTLGRMVGRWTFSGWSRDDSGNRYEPTGRATGAVEHRYFLDLDLDYTRNAGPDPNARHAGTMNFGAEPGRGINMTAWFDTTGNKSHFQGYASGDGSVLGLRGDPSANQDQDIDVVIKFLSDDEWTMDFIDRRAGSRQAVGAFTFRRAS
jgi:hypothetical protein